MVTSQKGALTPGHEVTELKSAKAAKQHWQADGGGSTKKTLHFVKN